MKYGAVELPDDVNVEFMCPECGHDSWGTVDTTAKTWIRYCKGYEGTCGFRWPETDDHLYMYVVKKILVRDYKVQPEKEDTV